MCNGTEVGSGGTQVVVAVLLDNFIAGSQHPYSVHTVYSQPPYSVHTVHSTVFPHLCPASRLSHTSGTDSGLPATEQHKLQQEIKIRAANRKPGGAIDPLLENLSTTIDTEKELEGTIGLIWNLIDEDANGYAHPDHMEKHLLLDFFFFFCGGGIQFAAL